MKTRKLAYALIVVAILALAVWMWRKDDTVKFVIASVAPASGAAGSAALTLTGSTTSKANPTAWVGRSIHVYTKSMGTLMSTVAAATSTSITTAPVAFAAPYAYTPAASDYARVFLKL